GESPIWSISLRLMVSLIRCSLECAGVIIRKVRRLGRPIMLTFGAGRVALIVVLALQAAGCSREQQDWRSAEAADTGEAYARFVEQYPDTELAVQARARLAQLDEERDWAQAGKIATADAYRAVPAGHPRGSAARAGGNSYGVQLGAFGSEASADREWRRLQGRFGAQIGGLSPRIIAAGNTSAPLYRLQAPAAGEAQARALCDSLREKSQP